jgi:uncharacterized protein YegJ (DUF2314 family)
MSGSSDLVPVFMPALGAILLNAEDRKGAPLDEAEALRIRDDAPCIMMTREDAASHAESRGPDIDPENCWFDFQALRKSLGRKPDVDGGVRIVMMARKSPEMAEAQRRARESFPRFREEIARCKKSGATPMIKTLLGDEDTDARINLWLNDARVTPEGFSGKVFEVPKSLPRYAPGQRIDVAADDVLDWMVNDDGVVHGAFSLLVHRAKLPPSERAEFDDHIGATRWVEDG